MPSKKIAFFPEAAYGPALNSIGIAQAIERRGHKAVFISDPGFVELYQSYGFEAHPVQMSPPMSPEESAKFWEDFVTGHVPNFYKPAYDQIDNYVKDCWTAIVDTVKYAQEHLPGVLKSVDPDLICIDNCIFFPAVKQHGVPWVRIISCSENEVEDPLVPPHLSGCPSEDLASHARYRARFNEAIGPLHAQFNAFLAEQGMEPYPIGQFFEVSPHLNMLLYPEPVKFKRQHPLQPPRFAYLEGCVRQEKPYEVPSFAAHDDAPLIYLSFGSLGCGDVAQIKRIIGVLGTIECRVLVNVGDYIDQYTDLPPNVIVDKWFPQPSVIPQIDLAIHHGGNNSFTECLYFGKPAIIIPFVWDGHDNATRVEETGHGFKLDRWSWTDEQLRDRVNQCLSSKAIQDKLAATSAFMQANNGPERAAGLLEDLLARTN